MSSEDFALLFNVQSEALTRSVQPRFEDIEGKVPWITGSNANLKDISDKQEVEREFCFFAAKRCNH